MKTEYKGYTITIERDEYPSNPREDDNLGTMICGHRNYTLGDVQYRESYEFHDAVDEITNNPENIWLPIYMYEHSGIVLSTKPFSDRWDSGQLGIIYCEKEKYEKSFPNLKGEELVKAVTGNLEDELETYNQYVQGEVYEYTVQKDGETLDSCCGFYGEDFCLEVAKRTVDYYWKKEAEKFIPGLEPVEANNK